MPDEKKKYIRFINSGYKTLFHLPDGGRVRITYPDGRQTDRVCRLIDEYHTEIGGWCYHICEFAERMEQNGAKYAPLDYIQDMEFYRKHFFAASEAGGGPAYYIIDETDTHGFAFAPRGAEEGKKYCVFEMEPNNYRPCPGKVVMWVRALQDIRPQDWGFDPAKIKAVTQRTKTAGRKAKRPKPER